MNARRCRKHIRSTPPPAFERLEPRTLLSATLIDGVLTLTGTDADDAIEVAAGPAAGQVVVLGVEGVAPGTLFSGVNHVVIRAGAGNDYVAVGSGMLDTLGAALGSRISGGEGDDVLVGGDGDDVIAGGVGSDFIIGGGGVNTADFSDAISGVIVDISSEQAVSGGDTDIIRHIRNVIGSAYDDTITGDHNDNHIDGGDGNDHIRAGGGNDTIVDLLGNNLVEAGAGHDHITTGTGNDTVYGEAGDDVIIDYGGVDVLDGGDGTNQITELEPQPAPLPEPPDVVDSTGVDSSASDPIEVDLGSDGHVELTGGGSSNSSDHFAFTAEADGMMTIDLATGGGKKEHVLLVVTDSSGNEVAVLNSKGNTSGTFEVVEGETYTVQARSMTKHASTYSVNLSAAPSPMDDVIDVLALMAPKRRK